jgi:hypothetical protein
MGLTLMEKQASGWFWRVPALLDWVQPTLTDAALSAVEAQLGVKLPGAYLALLRQQNGGYLRATWPASDARMLRGIGPKAPSITLGRAHWRPNNIVQKVWAPPKSGLLVPFDGDVHWDMCFDYRKLGPSAEPSITFVDSECEEVEPIAESFLAFLAGLADGLEKSTRVYGDVEAEGLARALAKQLGAAAPHPDEQAHGFATWRIALSGDHQWCWLSPNRVPAGFRREEQAERVVVSDQTALQLPEDPDCAVLVSCTDEAKGAVSNGLTALRLRTDRTPA